MPLVTAAQVHHAGAHAGTGPRSRTASVNVFYGDKQALKGIDIPSKKVTAFIGPSGCGKSTFLRCINRMNDINPSARYEGKSDRRPDDLRQGWTSIQSRCRCGSAWSSRSPIRSQSPSTRTSPTARASAGAAGPSWRSRVERRSARRRLWDEVKDRLASRARALGRPAAAPLHRPGPRDRPRDDPVRRADVGARSDRDASIEELIGNSRELHHRHRHPQHAAGGARLADEPPSCTRRADRGARPKIFTARRSARRTTSRAFRLTLTHCRHRRIEERDRHILQAFDSELKNLRRHISEMGGRREDARGASRRSCAGPPRPRARDRRRPPRRAAE